MDFRAEGRLDLGTVGDSGLALPAQVSAVDRDEGKLKDVWELSQMFRPSGHCVEVLHFKFGQIATHCALDQKHLNVTHSLHPALQQAFQRAPEQGVLHTVKQLQPQCPSSHS